MAHLAPKRKEELALLIDYIKTQKAQTNLFTSTLFAPIIPEEANFHNCGQK